MIAVMILGLLAAMATPAVLEARNRAQRSVCRANLRILESAAIQYMAEFPKRDRPGVEDLGPYIRGGEIPVCPSGGTYALDYSSGDVTATCTVEGHGL